MHRSFTARPISRIAGTLALILLLTTGLRTCRADTKDGGKAELKMTRVKNFYIARFGTFYVFVNGEKVGTIENGGSATFSFTPAKDGKNSITLSDLDDKEKKAIFSGLGEFKAGAGAEIAIECEATLAGTGIILRVTTNKEGTIGTDVSAEYVSTQLNKTLKKVVIRESPSMRLPKGAEKTVEDTVKVKHEVTITDHWKVEAEVKAKASVAWASVQVKVRGEIEKTTKRTYAVETECKRGIKVIGDGSSTKKVVWVEYYRTGTATVKIDGKDVEIPFEFKEDFDLLVEDVD